MFYVCKWSEVGLDTKMTDEDNYSDLAVAWYFLPKSKEPMYEEKQK